MHSHTIKKDHFWEMEFNPAGLIDAFPETDLTKIKAAGFSVGKLPNIIVAACFEEEGVVDFFYTAELIPDFFHLYGFVPPDGMSVEAVIDNIVLVPELISTYINWEMLAAFYQSFSVPLEFDHAPTSFNSFHGCRFPCYKVSVNIAQAISHGMAIDTTAIEDAGLSVKSIPTVDLISMYDADVEEDRLGFYYRFRDFADLYLSTFVLPVPAGDDPQRLIQLHLPSIVSHHIDWAFVGEVFGYEFEENDKNDTDDESVVAASGGAAQTAAVSTVRTALFECEVGAVTYHPQRKGAMVVISSPTMDVDPVRYNLPDKKVFSHDFLSWENLVLSVYPPYNWKKAGVDAVMRKKKLYTHLPVYFQDGAAEDPENENTTNGILEELRKFLPDHAVAGRERNVPKIPGKKNQHARLYVCAKGKLSDYFDMNAIVKRYKEMGLTLTEQDVFKLKELAEHEVSDFSDFAWFGYYHWSTFVWPNDSAPRIVAGLLHGIPVEVSCGIIAEACY